MYDGRSHHDALVSLLSFACATMGIGTATEWHKKQQSSNYGKE
jgi:hypothetical protein